MKISEGLKKFEHLDREAYFKKNQELSEGLWERQNLPTVFDLAEYLNGTETESMKQVFDFFDNEEDFDKMMNKDTRLYNQDESSSFISKVMASNNKEISDSGYLYKLIMSSADDYRITQESCSSKGQEFDVFSEEFNEEIYNFYIKDMFITEIDKNCTYRYENFLEEFKDILNKNNGIIHVLNPITCDLHTEHSICRKCSGELPKGLVNIGTFTCLCVTEFATQSALSSMNKGVKRNINEIVSSGYQGKDNWEEIKEWIEKNLKDLESSPVEARYYQIVYLSRVREGVLRSGEKYPFVTSLKNSINHSNNPFGAFIFSSNDKNFRRMFEARNFEDNSLKLKIAMNNFKEYN